MMRMLGFKNFTDGICTPSGLSVGVMLITGFVCALLAVLSAPVFMASKFSVVLAESRTDHHLFVTADLFRLANLDSGKPILAVVGASVTLSSLGGKQKVATALNVASGQDFDVFVLASSRQNILEHMLMLEHLPDDRPVYVVLGIGPSRFTWKPEDYVETINNNFFGKDGPMFVQSTKELSDTVRSFTGLPAVDHSGFYITRLNQITRKTADYLRGRDQSRDENQHISRMPISRAAFEDHAALVVERFDGAEAAIKENHQRLSILLAYVKTRENIHLVVMEHPIRPEFVTDFLGANRYARHLGDMRRIMGEAAVPYFIPARQAGLVDSDYYDWAHIHLESAQNKLRTIIVSEALEVRHE